MNHIAATVAPVAAPVAARWIVNRRFDLLWFFGGSLLSLAALGLYFGFGVSILALFWIWLLGFDGPHIAAAFTRTYVDLQEWRTRRGMLLFSLLAFAVGPACLVLNAVTGSDAPFLGFLALSAVYGYYHIVRQHYGFLALYKSVARDFGRLDLHLDRWCLYAGLWLPYFYFLFTHPRARAEMGMGAVVGPVEGFVLAAVGAAWGLSLLLYVGRTIQRFGASAHRPQVWYFLVTVGLHGIIYFFIATFEPVYAKSNGPDQDFLLISVVTTLFHNIQYLGLVWFHNHNRYGEPVDDFGPARVVNRSAGHYLLACGAFSFVYLLLACWTGVFPGCQVFMNMKIGGATGSQIGLSLWWGLALHHYYLDQKIWRVKGDPRLRKNLGLG